MLNLALSDAFRPGFAQSLLSFMSHPASFTSARDPLPDHEQKQAALSYLNEAWAEARHDGVDGDCLAQASLFAAFAELVGTFVRGRRVMWQGELLAPATGEPVRFLETLKT